MEIMPQWWSRCETTCTWELWMFVSIKHEAHAELVCFVSIFHGDYSSPVWHHCGFFKRLSDCNGSLLDMLHAQLKSSDSGRGGYYLLYALSCSWISKRGGPGYTHPLTTHTKTHAAAPWCPLFMYTSTNPQPLAQRIAVSSLSTPAALVAAPGGTGGAARWEGPACLMPEQSIHAAMRWSFFVDTTVLWLSFSSSVITQSIWAWIIRRCPFRYS